MWLLSWICIYTTSFSLIRVLLRGIRTIQTIYQQGCIPVGCIPPAAVAVSWGGGSASVHAEIPPLGVGLEDPPQCEPRDHPWMWAWRTPQVWAWRPPRCGPGDLQGQTLNFPPWVWAWRPPLARLLNFPLSVWPGDPPKARPLKLPLGVGQETCKACWDTTCKACWDTTPPPRGQTDTCKNITFANYVCGR